MFIELFFNQGASDKKKAVMVFLHGGAFNFGSGSTDIYTPDYLIDENVIVVTINYRLNVLGVFIETQLACLMLFLINCDCRVLDKI